MFELLCYKDERTTMFYRTAKVWLDSSTMFYHTAIVWPDYSTMFYHTAKVWLLPSTIVYQPARVQTGSSTINQHSVKCGLIVGIVLQIRNDTL